MRSCLHFLVTIAVVVLAGCDSREAARGRLLFSGEMSISSRVVGHGNSLPAEASRCANCHERPSPGTSPASGAQRQVIGGALSSRSLLELRSRRGGPPSRFDAHALCRLLRTGVDPANIVIPSVMPRYDVSDADCEALWDYLSAADEDRQP